jgi:hypothetical protein
MRPTVLKVRLDFSRKARGMGIVGWVVWYVLKVG